MLVWLHPPIQSHLWQAKFTTICQSLNILSLFPTQAVLENISLGLKW